MDGLALPMVVMAIWIILLAFWLAWAHIGSIARGVVDVKEFAKTGVWPHAWIRNAGDNFNNQSEIPLLFFALCLLLMVLKFESGSSAMFHHHWISHVGWLFVGSRIAHSLNQLTVNHIPTRFLTFLFGVICVAVIAVFALGVVLGLLPRRPF